MKHTMKLLALAALLALALSGCGSVLHNGTEMDIAQVKVTGLPVNPYSAGQTMVFSYDTGSGWIHDNATAFADPYYQASVAADGSLTFNFSPPLKIVTSQLKFLLIDPDKLWATLKIDKKHSGKSGGDATIDNNWAGVLAPVTIVGTVSGDDVTWEIQ